MSKILSYFILCTIFFISACGSDGGTDPEPEPRSMEEEPASTAERYEVKFSYNSEDALAKGDLSILDIMKSASLLIAVVRNTDDHSYYEEKRALIEGKYEDEIIFQLPAGNYEVTQNLYRDGYSRAYGVAQEFDVSSDSFVRLPRPISVPNSSVYSDLYLSELNLDFIPTKVVEKYISNYSDNPYVYVHEGDDLYVYESGNLRLNSIYLSTTKSIQSLCFLDDEHQVCRKIPHDFVPRFINGKNWFNISDWETPELFSVLPAENEAFVILDTFNFTNDEGYTVCLNFVIGNDVDLHQITINEVEYSTDDASFSRCYWDLSGNQEFDIKIENSVTDNLLTLVSSGYTDDLNLILQVKDPDYEPSNMEIDAVNGLVELEFIANLTTIEEYHLDDYIFRQEFAKIATLVADLDPKTICDNIFADVSAITPNTWACKYIEALADAGKISTSNTNFHPEGYITKAETLAAILSAVDLGYSFNSTIDDTWQKQVVDFAVERGIVENFTNYDSLTTRGFLFSVAYAAYVNEDDDDLLSDLLGDLIDC
ncbi:S-layer homology domain-containing protein [Candidatus Gracilibacteria bacterium 28_42_T64]|nr:S-layer homology domain-containing protein [Candidatus Gracilibacteria bacterium 28_42_T64]